MAKKKSKEELDIDDSLDLNDEEESSGGNKLLNAFIVVVVIAIWQYKKQCPRQTRREQNGGCRQAIRRET